MNIVDVVGEYTELSPAGSYWKGKCPFSHEVHSFVVSPERGIFYCFGCHEAGDIPYFIGKIKKN